MQKAVREYGGVATARSNIEEIFVNNPELLDLITLHIAGKKQKIGNGEHKVIRVDGVYFHKFSSSKLISRTMNNLFLNRKLITNLKKSHHIIFQSNFSQRSFEHFIGIPPHIKSTRVIRNGCNQKIFYPGFPKEKQKLKFISVSVDLPWKRMHYLTEMSKILNNRNIEHELKIITVEPKKSIQRFKKNMKFYSGKKENNKSIKVLYDVEHKDMRSHYITSDAYVSFSRIDPCPNSVLEAASCGLPIIGPNSGGIKEINNFTELLFNCPGSELDLLDWRKYSTIDQEEISAAVSVIEHYVKNKKHFDKLALDKVQKYSLLNMQSEYKNYFEEIGKEYV